MAEIVSPRAFSVEEVNHYLRETLAEDDFLANILVYGQVTGCKLHSSGHLYFTLREGNAGLKVVVFRRYVSLLKNLPAEGEAVLVLGGISLYERDGSCQLYGRDVFPQGKGVAQQALEQLRHRLGEEGLFAPERKKPLPRYASSVGVVTGAASAAWADIQRIVSSRAPGAVLKLYPAIVQGAQAPASLCAALRKADAGGHDVLICGRGGGAEEDLSAFDTEAVVRAISALQTPVISAVGHESDVSLADLAADVRAATPTHAATLAVPDQQKVKEEIAALAQRLKDALALKIGRETARFNRVALSPALSAPQQLLSGFTQKLSLLEMQLNRGAQKQMEQKTAQWEMLRNHLALLNPLSTLTRGYSLVTLGGTLVKDAAQVQAGDEIQVTLAKGALLASVLEVKEENRGEREEEF